MKSERYSKFLAGLVTSLILFSQVISPALAAAGDTTRVSVASDGMQSNNESREPTISTTLNSSLEMFIENIGQFGSPENLPMPAALAQASEVSAGDNVWISNGPYGGRTLTLGIDPVTPTTLYAGTWYGGVFKSTDGGDSWSAINSVLTDTDVRALGIDSLSSATAIAAGRAGGGTHTCALNASGSVKCWGYNGYGALGDGTNTDRLTPVDVIGLTSGVSAIDAGSWYTCALTTSGGVKCWGDNGWGQLGDGTTTKRSTPVDVIGLTSGVMMIATGSDHTCALTTSGGVKCWGWNTNGALGDGTTTSRSTPVDVTGLTSGVKMIATGHMHTCAITVSGGVKCWGYNDYGQLGDGTTTDRLTPVDVIGLTTGVNAVGTGNMHTCALMTSGGVKCWGSSLWGMLGDGSLTSGVSAIAVGSFHSCALMSSGGIKCWGANGQGGLGDGTTTNSSAPVDVSGLTNGVSASDAGGNYTCAVMASGGVKCWGANGTGQLGDGTTTERHTPVDVIDSSSTFSVSGRVTDGSSNAIAGASVSDGAVHIVTTDSSGNYTLSWLAAGTYTITPFKSGYTFSPASRAVTVPPDSTGQDFTGTIVPPTGKPIVVLVHGWQGLGTQVYCSEGITLYPNNQNFDGENGDVLDDMPDWLTSQGFEVWSAHLTTGPDQTDSLRSNALCLRDQIAQVRSRAPDGKVILIAHSMGGLVSRAYIEDDGLYQNDVKTLITLGSPHQGVPVPWWDAVKRLMGFFRGWNCDNQAAVCEFTAGIDQFNQQHSVRRPGVEYYTVSGDLRFSDSTWMSRLLSAAIPGADDGAVPQTSGNGLSGSHQTLATNEAHIKDFGLFSYFGPPPGDLYSFAYADCIQPVLAGNQDGCHAIASQVPAATATPSFSALSPIVEGTVSSGQLVTHALGMDGSGSVLFTASWPTGDITFTLKSPSGQVIDPAYALAHPDQVNYLQSDTGQTPLGATYAITSAEAGLWTMNIQAGSVPGGSTSYALLAAMESPITLTGQTDQDWYIPGASATLTATLGGSPLSATVTATILRADGVTDTLPLSSIGGGQYQASYSVPAAPGYAEVRLVASGTTASSLSFERGTSLAFQISPNTFILNNTYSDALVAPDLNVTVGVNAAVSGTVGLSADLVDGSGNFVAHALTIQDVVAGTPTLTLQFNGTDIYASQRNGPYTLTNVLLTDESGAALVTQQALAVYTTAPYLYTDFAPNRIYLPLILR